MSATALTRAEERDLKRAEHYAHEVLRHCEYLRVNGPTDSIRWGTIATYAWQCWRAAARADRRAARAHGWYQWVWRVPRGYDKRARDGAAT